ncbi:peptidoglycan-binding protein [Streptomyces sp. NBC_00820]|nr:peptidoglycan-binding protein [Streptomyces sp. NBC_00820]
MEPVRILRLRRFDALAELMREVMPDLETMEPPDPSPTARGREDAEDDTQELPPVAAAPPPAPTASAPPTRPTSPAATIPPRAKGPLDTGSDGASRHRSGVRRAAVAATLGAAALVGFGCALLLPARHQTADAAPRGPSRSAATAQASAAPPASVPGDPAGAPPASAPTTAVDPDGSGTLRQGDTGPEVVELQQRLLRIPDVYRDGSTQGTYDSTLTEAVARFQLWYGISGDETGVYGDDTRRALESRTSAGTG